MTINPTARFTDIIVPMQVHDSTLLISCNADTFNTKDSGVTQLEHKRDVTYACH